MIVPSFFLFVTQVSGKKAELIARLEELSSSASIAGGGMGAGEDEE